MVKTACTYLPCGHVISVVCLSVWCLFACVCVCVCACGGWRDSKLGIPRRGDHVFLPENGVFGAQNIRRLGMIILRPQQLLLLSSAQTKNIAAQHSSSSHDPTTTHPENPELAIRTTITAIYSYGVLYCVTLLLRPTPVVTLQPRDILGVSLASSPRN